MLPGARLRELGRGADKQVTRREDGTASQERDHRFMGANSITLRREMQRRGIEDPRFVTVGRASWINRENNVSAAVLKPGAQPIELVSRTAAATTRWPSSTSRRRWASPSAARPAAR